MQHGMIAAIQMTSFGSDVEGKLASIDRFLGDAVGSGTDIGGFPELLVGDYNTSEQGAIRAGKNL